MTAPEVKVGQVWRRRQPNSEFLPKQVTVRWVLSDRVGVGGQVNGETIAWLTGLYELVPDLPEIGSHWLHERYGVNELQTVHSAGDWGVALQRPDGLPGAVTLDYFRRNYVPFVEAPRLPDCEGWINLYDHPSATLGALYPTRDAALIRELCGQIGLLHVGVRDGVPFAELEQP